MGLFRLEREAQRFARAQQVRLAHNVIKYARPQLLGQRRARRALAEQIVHGSTTILRSCRLSKVNLITAKAQRSKGLHAKGFFAFPLRLCGEVFEVRTSV